MWAAKYAEHETLLQRAGGAELLSIGITQRTADAHSTVSAFPIWPPIQNAET
jgi:hypothetical protein